MVENVLLLSRAVIDDLFLHIGQVAERHIGAHPHGATDIGHQRPHQRIPGGHSALVNGQAFVRHKGGAVNGLYGAGAAAGAAGTLAVKGKLFRRRGVKAGPAFGADQLLPGGHGQGGRKIMPVGAAVAGKAGIHQPQAVQQLGAGAKGAADARHPRPLVQRQRGGNIQNLVHISFGGLGHAAARVGGKCVQIPARTFGIQHAQRQRRFAGTGYTRNADDFVQRHIDINIF